ncbi:MAG: hypothetical protein WD875_06755 [Pirellulales bacterium]
MDFVGAVALAALAVVLFTRPTDNVWFKIGGGAAAVYAVFCVYRGATRSDD